MITNKVTELYKCDHCKREWDGSPWPRVYGSEDIEATIKISTYGYEGGPIKYHLWFCPDCTVEFRKFVGWTN